MADRDRILDALPSSTGGAVPETRPVEAPGLPTDVLWREFEVRLAALGGQVLPLPAIKFLFEHRNVKYWADEDAAAYVPRTAIHADSVWDAEIGVCLADCAIAETGSVVVSAGAGRSRLTSLAPPVNVVLVADDQIVATVEEAFARLGPTTTVVITGTSRTADIEGIMIRGVHGPREVYVVRI